jgi:type I restriction enzyme S subunit
MSSRAPIGYLAITEVPVAINQGFVAMKAKKGMSNLFLLYWTHFAHEYILSKANGSTFLEINKANFRSLLLKRPDDNVLKAFDTLIRQMYKSVVSNERESHSLVSLRNTLLPKLISGELPINFPERIIKGVG